MRAHLVIAASVFLAVTATSLVAPSASAMCMALPLGNECTTPTPNCSSDSQSAPGPDGSRTDEYWTVCGDGYSCKQTNHYNDPNTLSSTTYAPPGCENDPRWGR